MRLDSRRERRRGESRGYAAWRIEIGPSRLAVRRLHNQPHRFRAGTQEVRRPHRVLLPARLQLGGADRDASHPAIALRACRARTLAESDSRRETAGGPRSDRQRTRERPQLSRLPPHSPAHRPLARSNRPHRCPERRVGRSVPRPRRAGRSRPRHWFAQVRRCSNQPLQPTHQRPAHARQSCR